MNRFAFPFAVRLLLLVLPFLSLLTACQSTEDHPRQSVQLKSQSAQIVRIEQILCESGEEESAADLILRKYPVFSDIFFSQIIFPKDTESIVLDTLVKNFCSSPAIRHLIDTTRILFSDMTGPEQKLGEISAYFHYYFPEEPLPEYYTYVSEFGLGTFTAESGVVGIGLDFFLGEAYPYYDPAVFPRYRVKTMTPDYLPAGVALALSESVVPGVTTGNMLDFMIRNGKALYLASRLLPKEEMYKICQYSPEEMDWVEDNELDIWAYLLELGLFYDTDFRNFQKFIYPSPHSPGMPDEAPGRVANWIGYRIVETYMNKNPELGMKELMNEIDYQKIMDKSGYKPRRK